MKKALLLSGLLAIGMTLNAQQRLVLYEEFTGENCPPCAQTNPGLWQLMTQGSNAQEIVMIKYQSPIPSSGLIYNQDASDVNNRLQYYSVNFAPWGEMDGALPPGIPPSTQNANHPGYLTQNMTQGQSMIDQADSVTSPFTITISSYTIENGNINATIDVKANQAFSGTSLVLRAALIETLNFTTPPGTNGETTFENVVRKMYPSPDGQTAPNSWTLGQSQSFTISGAVPSYVNLSDDHGLVVWIQDDGNKTVEQAQVAMDYTTGIKDVISNSNDLHIYPNPVTNTLNLDLNMVQTSSVTFSFVNVLGQQMQNVQKNLTKGNNTIDLNTEALTPGVYFLNIATTSGTIQRKFVKQ